MMGMQWRWIVLFAVVVSSARAMLSGLYYSHRENDLHKRIDAEVMPKKNTKLIQQLVELTAIARGAQLLRELQNEQDSNKYSSRISRACYFSPVQCLLMKKETGINDLLKIGEVYDVMAGKEPSELQQQTINDSFGKQWSLRQRYRLLRSGSHFYVDGRMNIKK